MDSNIEKCDVVVHIIESERGWGQKIDEVKRFTSTKDAEIFVDEFNSENDLDDTPDIYWYAKIATINGYKVT